MITNFIKPRKALNKAYLKVKPNRSEIEQFKKNLIQLLDRSDDQESEEFHKNLVSDFLKNTYYSPNHFINTKGRSDLVIHNGKEAKSTVGVIIETKKPKASGNPEMVKKENINTKALHELILYFLRERMTHKNLEIKYLVATNIFEWYIFDASLFEKQFAQNKDFVKQFIAFEEGRLSGTTTDYFYNEIAKPLVAKLLADPDTSGKLEYTWFDFREYDTALRNQDKKDDTKLIALFKLLSPEHLLKLPFTNDSNSLDKAFYSELLHLIGLSETKEGSKKVIGRKPEGKRDPGSLLENTIVQLDSMDIISGLRNAGHFGSTYQERLFNVALELVITWINRILFLKLLEAQLISYHKGDASFAFLNFQKVKNFDDLNTLFFSVLARKPENRIEKVKHPFAQVPYLNSSLFERSEIEAQSIVISNLMDEQTIPVLSSTVLKDSNGNKRRGDLNAIEYIFEFLNSYDFSSEGSEEIQEENKALINASVLGLIFEKINGYKDGSFFTPGFITMYMCRETIRRAVVQKFNEALSGKITPPNPISKGDFGPNDDSRSSEVDESTSNYPETSSKSSPLLRGAGGVYSPRRKIIPYNKNLKELARKLRKESTRSEVLLWKELKGKFEEKYDFQRQKPLDEFIADFFCHELQLVIELDGITHDWEETMGNDEVKERRLNELGLNVLRFPDDEVSENIDGVVDTIRLYIKCFEADDGSGLQYEDTPLNPLSRGDFINADPGSFFESFKKGSEIPYGTETSSKSSPLLSSNSTNNPPLSRAHLPRQGAGGVSKYSSLTDIYEAIGTDFTKQEANRIINSLKICDPAVGSGHFLVSALNEIIAIKSELKILMDRTGKTLRDYHVEVVNDELVITDDDGRLFEYHANSPLLRGAGGVSESQRIQEALFHEKQLIIENCLFGVDINPNSVKICRLRLWIELLKHAYYVQEETLKSSSPVCYLESEELREGYEFPSVGQLQTLPNIDINIKFGNSLISRFDLDADISQALKKSKWTINTYRTAVQTYREARSKEEKREMERLIEDIKKDFESEITKNDKRVLRLNKVKGELFNLTNQQSLFGMSDKEKKAWEKQVEKLTKSADKLEAEIEEIKSNKIYENAFEWRFEFPEVLDELGNFVGFDVVIGNPPYIRQEEFSELKPYFQSTFQTYAGTADLYVYFIERGLQVARQGAQFVFILPNKWMRAGYGLNLRKWIKNYQIESIIDFGDLPVFEEATTYPCIWQIQKEEPDSSFFKSAQVATLDFPDGLNKYLTNELIDVDQNLLPDAGWTLVDDKVQRLLEKIKNAGTPLGEYVNGKIFRGIVTGLNEAFVIDATTRERLIDEDQNSKEIIKPFLAGKDIKRYQQPKSIKYLIFTRRGIEIENYPAVLKHLLEFKDKLSKKAGNAEWYELQASPSDSQKFEKVKIMYPDISKNLNFILDFENHFSVNTVYNIESQSISLLGYLNSNLFLFYYQSVSNSIRGGYMRFFTDYISFCPVPKGIGKLESKVSQILSLKKQNPSADTSALENEIDVMVYKLYDLSYDEVKIVDPEFAMSEEEYNEIKI